MSSSSLFISFLLFFFFFISPAVSIDGCKQALTLHGRGRWVDALNLATNTLIAAATTKPTAKNDENLPIMKATDCIFSAALSLNAIANFGGGGEQVASMSDRAFTLVRRLNREKSGKGELQQYLAGRERLATCHRETPRQPNVPYTSCGTFRTLTHWVHDGDNCGFDPQLVRSGESVFVDSFLLREFFENEHPYIRANYTLVTHCSDAAAPDIFDVMLESTRIVAWFAQNTDISFHPKLFPIPIGLGDRVFAHGDRDTLEEVMTMVEEGMIERTELLYINVNVQTNKDRLRVLQALEANGFNTNNNNENNNDGNHNHRVDFRSYLEALARYKFVVSPAGNGLDTHRTWEALLMGCFPIIETSTLDRLYENLPVVIVQDWEEVTVDLLERAENALRGREFNRDKLFAKYWEERIRKGGRLE